MRSLKLVAISICTLALFTSFAFANTPPVLPEAQIAPDFSLPDESGEVVNLSEFKGKYVVLEWTNPDCPFVKRHYKEQTMKQLSEKYGKEGVVWLAINSTHYMKAESNKEWKRENKLSFPILSDPSGEVGKLYGAKTTPHMFVINPEGQIIYQGAIDDDAYGDKTSAKRVAYVDQVLSQKSEDGARAAKVTTPYGCSVKYKG